MVGFVPHCFLILLTHCYFVSSLTHPFRFFPLKCGYRTIKGEEIEETGVPMCVCVCVCVRVCWGIAKVRQGVAELQLGGRELQTWGVELQKWRISGINYFQFLIFYCLKNDNLSKLSLDFRSTVKKTFRRNGNKI